MRCVTRWLILFLAWLVPVPLLAQVPDALMVAADTITGAADTVTIVNLPSGRGTASLTVSNYCSCTLVIEGRGTPASDWEAVNGAPTISADGVYFVTASGLAELRVRASAYSSGTTTIFIRVSSVGGGSGSGAGGGAGSADSTAENQDEQTALLTTINTSLNTLASSPSFDANTDEAAQISGPQIHAYGSAATPSAMSADGDATRVWSDLFGRLHIAAEKAEDLASANGDLLMPAACIRDDTLDVRSATEGDYEPCHTTSAGAIWMQDVLLAANMVAHDAANAGNPVGVGFRATNTLAGLTLVADADRTWGMAGLDGVPIVRLHANLEDRVSGYVENTDGAATQLVAAQGANTRFCATAFVVSNSSATNVTVLITDGSGGTSLTRLPAAANMGGAVVPLGTPLCTSANTALFFDGSAAASTVSITAIGFKTKL